MTCRLGRGHPVPPALKVVLSLFAERGQELRGAMQNQPPFSALAVLLLSLNLVYMGNTEQAEESPATACALGTGHGTLWCLFLLIWRGKVSILGLQVERGS